MIKAVVNELEIGVVCNGYQQGSKHIHEYGKENRMRELDTSSTYFVTIHLHVVITNERHCQRQDYK